jgi:hypothetical protein
MARRSRPRPAGVARAIGLVSVERADVSLLDVIDHVLNQGVVVSGELMIGLADVDLIYVRLLALVCAADRAQPSRRARRPVTSEHRRG